MNRKYEIFSAEYGGYNVITLLHLLYSALSRSQSIDRSQMETIGEEERGDPHPYGGGRLPPHRTPLAGGAKTKIATPVSARKAYNRRH